MTLTQMLPAELDSFKVVLCELLYVLCCIVAV